ncbi:uncharacterized protein LOC133548218 [Nerophis ophidion]|uniref:uncharacterized protein LOC133548218 n=1 Tax=Nerophis ophidion TaxID=159077 RepID=UPI002ADF360E|nr:uncharacterized protein LOC133548218 [Nerophis ophidion]
MASNIPPPEPMKMAGDTHGNWKNFRAEFEDYLLATGLNEKEKPVQAAALRRLMGNGCLHVYKYNLGLTVDQQKDAGAILEALEGYFTPPKNVTFESPEQEVQKIFKSKHPMDTEVTKAKIIGFGVGLLEGVDPNPANFVGAGVVHTKCSQVGCLFRLEPNTQAQVEHTHTHIYGVCGSSLFFVQCKVFCFFNATEMKCTFGT